MSSRDSHWAGDFPVIGRLARFNYLDIARQDRVTMVGQQSARSRSEQRTGHHWAYQFAGSRRRAPPEGALVLSHRSQYPSPSITYDGRIYAMMPRLAPCLNRTAQARATHDQTSR
jgi:hypothetical protein